MAFTVVYDACVLYPASLGDLLLRLADLLTSLERTGLVRSVAEKCLGFGRYQVARAGDGGASTVTS